jgi:two-component system chemotaxis response regulator CheB
MARGRVLLVDDSVVIRKVIAELLASDPSVESVATASNGRIALDKLAHVNPNLVVLDVEMPELEGIATLKQLRLRAPDLPVLMFSGLTERAGVLTLEALSLGASDYVTKPTTVGTIVPVERVRDELLAKTRALLRVSRDAVFAAPSIATPSLREEVVPVELLAIGASTGGPNALAAIIAELPGDLPVPVVIAQHMPPLFTKLFAERLHAQSSLRVREGAMGERLRPGEVWVAPGNFHMAVMRDADGLVLYVHQGLPENSCRPAVDVLFRSVADACGPHALGVVLTGMGTDGLRGSEHIRAAGGHIVVQDEASSVVWSMPGAVAMAGLADEVVSVDHMAAVLLRQIQRGRGEVGQRRGAGGASR